MLEGNSEARSVPVVRAFCSGGHAGAIPIEHVIVIIKQNYAFDNYFGSIPDWDHAQVDGRGDVAGSQRR
jgi:phospholipase C